MRKKFIALGFALVLLPFSAAQAAEEWGIEHEETARIEAKVVDILCELNGNCPDNCGGGMRQLGLLKEDGTLLLAIKNFDYFAGTIADLLPYCGKKIIADGLYVPNPKLHMFVLQFKRLAPDGEWSRADAYSKDWAQKHPDLDVEEWFRHDPTIKQVIAEDGVFGIPGLEPKKE